MQLETAATCMTELGHQKRLSIFKLLVTHGEQGIETGKIAEQLAIPNSTLSHHLKKLAAAQLITQCQDKQKIYCKPNCTTLNQLIDFLTQNCCKAN